MEELGSAIRRARMMGHKIDNNKITTKSDTTTIKDDNHDIQEVVQGCKWRLHEGQGWNNH